MFNLNQKNFWLTIRFKKRSSVQIKKRNSVQIKKREGVQPKGRNGVQLEKRDRVSEERSRVQIEERDRVVEKFDRFQIEERDRVVEKFDRFQIEERDRVVGKFDRFQSENRDRVIENREGRRRSVIDEDAIEVEEANRRNALGQAAQSNAPPWQDVYDRVLSFTEVKVRELEAQAVLRGDRPRNNENRDGGNNIQARDQNRNSGNFSQNRDGGQDRAIAPVRGRPDRGGPRAPPPAPPPNPPSDRKRDFDEDEDEWEENFVFVGLDINGVATWSYPGLPGGRTYTGATPGKAYKKQRR
ncbi:hypothetical protein FKW77_002287 [Venturia effusa]|uniref:Uncharacterized protein n=1 Tax=Venturia effusa TaxID=50376 RepID=A0A517LNG7_9PEZI|nr:hypothetical protein FKW77_002287 [Venturia effusa]